MLPLRSFEATPITLLRLMCAEGGFVHVDQAAEFQHVHRKTIIQGICRLRRDGLQIYTIPRARNGPYPIWGYRLAHIRTGLRLLRLLTEPRWPPPRL